MDELKINGKAVYTTKGAAREYGRIGCNFYTGCPNECSYCFLKRGAPSAQLGGNVVRLKKCFKDEGDALRVLMKEAVRHLDVLRQTGVFFSFTTDPMIRETRDLTLKATGVLTQMGVKVRILTKCADWYDDKEFSNFLHALNFADGKIDFGFTLTGRDDMEPNASSNADRIRVMRYLHASRFKTWASIEPVIDWESAANVIGPTLGSCDHYKIGLRSGVKKDYYDLEKSGQQLDELTKMIVEAGRTVYLKESARALLRRCYDEDRYNEILSRTVDMDGRPMCAAFVNLTMKK